MPDHAEIRLQSHEPRARLIVEPDLSTGDAAFGISREDGRDSSDTGTSQG